MQRCVFIEHCKTSSVCLCGVVLIHVLRKCAGESSLCEGYCYQQLHYVIQTASLGTRVAPGEGSLGTRVASLYPGEGSLGTRVASLYPGGEPGDEGSKPIPRRGAWGPG